MIFLTGSTGYLGKVTLWYLLKFRKEEIYVLVRDKKDKTAKMRVDELLEADIYLDLRNEIHRVHVVPGCLLKENFGMKLDHLKTILDNATYIIHSAASISFKQTLSDAMESNVKPVQRILDICGSCKKLKRYIHVSTAYVNKPSYDVIKPEMNVVYDDEYLECVINCEYDFAEIRGHHNNEYSFSKQIGENVVYNYAKKHGLDTIIIRPSIISSSLQYPYAGYCEKGFVTSISGALLSGGIVNVTLHKNSYAPNLIPVDVVSQSIYDSISCTNEEKFKIIHATSVGTVNIKYWQNAFTTSRSPSPLKGWITCFTEKTMLFRVCIYAEYVKNRILSFIIGKPLHVYSTRFHNAYDYYLGNYWNFQSSVDTPLLSVVDKQLKSFLFCDNQSPTEVSVAGGRVSSYENILYFLSPGWVTYFVPLCVYWVLLYLNISTLWSFVAAFTTYSLSWFIRPRDSREGYSYTTRLFAILLNFIILKGFNRVIVNEEKLLNIPKNKPVLFASSHRSYVDFLIIPFLQSYYDLPREYSKRCNIFACSNFEKIPIIGKICEWVGCIFVDRDGKSSKVSKERMNKQIRRSLIEKEFSLLFPEGTRSRNGLLGQCRYGVLKSVHKLSEDCVVVPVSFTYQKILDKDRLSHKKYGGTNPFFSFRNTLGWFVKLFRGDIDLGSFYVNIGDPIDFNSSCDFKTSCETIMTSIQSGFVVWDYQLGEVEKEATVLLKRKGVRILKSLPDESEFCEDDKRAWEHWFYPEARVLLNDRDKLRERIETHGHNTDDVECFDKDKDIARILEYLFSEI